MVLHVIVAAGTRLVGEILLVSMSWPYSSLFNYLPNMFYLGTVLKLLCLNTSVHCLVQNNSFLLPVFPQE